MHQATGRESYAHAAYYSMVGGYVGGWVAAVAGATDYLSIPKQTQTKKVANTHAILNIGLMGLYTVNLLLRRKRRSTLLGTVLSAACNGLLYLSAWYGGDLVYQHGMRVKGQQELKEATDLKLPGDDAMSEAMDRLAEKMPAGGPVVG